MSRAICRFIKGDVYGKTHLDIVSYWYAIYLQWLKPLFLRKARIPFPLKSMMSVPTNFLGVTFIAIPFASPVPIIGELTKTLQFKIISTYYTFIHEKTVFLVYWEIYPTKIGTVSNFWRISMCTNFRAYFSFLILLISTDLFANSPTICTMTMNSKNERDLFEIYYKPEFQFKELTVLYGPKGRQARMNDERWFHNACADKSLTCDIILISGHFGGEFAGDGNGPTLKLSTIKDEAVRGTCKSILEKSKEVYLFGCNTLAEKVSHNRDSRFSTYSQYYNHLMHDNYEAVDAKFITDAKFLPVGFTIREQMQLIFTGPKIIYGFNDVAPVGHTVAPTLKAFLDFRQSRGGLTRVSLEQQSRDISIGKGNGGYWGDKFIEFVTQKSHADFGIAFSDRDSDGKKLIQARNLNWGYRYLITKKSKAINEKSWEAIFENVISQMRSDFPKEMAPEVLDFFHNTLAPIVRKHKTTPFIQDRIESIKRDPQTQEFLAQMKNIWTQSIEKKSPKYPALNKQIESLFFILDLPLTQNGSESLK